MNIDRELFDPWNPINLHQYANWWTGHSDYKAMKPYIDIADEIKAEAMKKLNQFCQ